MRLPDTLAAGADNDAITRLACYYGTGRNHPAHSQFTGAWFDTWDSTGTRAADKDRFTADDLYGVSFLAVTVHPHAGHQLLVARTDEFTDLLKALPADRDLVEEHEPWPDDHPGWQLDQHADGVDAAGLESIATKRTD